MIKFSKEVRKMIKMAKSIAIFTHITPDCDAIGSSLTLKEGLSLLGKNVVCFAKDPLTKNQSLVFGTDIFSKQCDFSKFDLCISVDASSFDRLGDYAQGFKEHKQTIVLDHHRGNSLTASIIYCHPEYSSCCEMVMEFLDFLKVKITKKMASMLYSGLSADTNSFRNTNVTYQTFLNASRLVGLGAEISKINEYQYKNRTRVEVACKQYLWTNLKIRKDIAYCCVSHENLLKMKAKKSDCDTFSNDLLGIDGVNYSFSLIEEENGKINLSMRSKEGYNVQKVASLLNGGGHVCAAGAKIWGKTLSSSTNLVLKLIQENRNDL